MTKGKKSLSLGKVALTFALVSIVLTLIYDFKGNFGGDFLFSYSIWIANLLLLAISIILGLIAFFANKEIIGLIAFIIGLVSFALFFGLLMMLAGMA